jgi:hypothetical protein
MTGHDLARSHRSSRSPPRWVARGKGREIRLFLWVVSLLFVAYSGLEPSERLLTI